MSTLLLTRSDVEALLSPLPLLAVIRDGFVAAAGATIAPQRARSALPGGGASATVLFPGLLLGVNLTGIPAYSVKVHAKFPGRNPAIRGLLQLFDLETGSLLAVMDSGHLTALRTAAAGAVAADALARADAKNVALVGAGVQNAWQLELLLQVRPLRAVTVYDTAPLKTGPFVRRMARKTDAKLVPTDSLAEALEHADIVVAATWAREPFLYPEMLASGAHVTTLGADEPGKAEVSAALISASRFFCDDRALALEMGAVGNVGLDEAAITGELGEVLAGKQPGRLGDEFTVYGGVGLAWMDLVAAWAVYQKALDAGVGQRVDFLA
jgi:ornithine cyclodeaminase/alanine dehydrogenase-like protein (mu-crystallin family)